MANIKNLSKYPEMFQAPIHVLIKAQSHILSLWFIYMYQVMQFCLPMFEESPSQYTSETGKTQEENFRLIIKLCTLSRRNKSDQWLTILLQSTLFKSSSIDYTNWYRSLAFTYVSIHHLNSIGRGCFPNYCIHIQVIRLVATSCSYSEWKPTTMPWAPARIGFHSNHRHKAEQVCSCAQLSPLCLSPPYICNYISEMWSSS